MKNPEEFGKGYRKDRFSFKKLLRRRLDVHGKYLTANPVDVLAIAKQFPVKNQGSSGSCGGQAWAYYIQTLKYLRDGGIIELSAKDIYSHCFISPEGSTETDLINFVENNGVDTEGDVISYNPVGNPPDESFMETISPRQDSSYEQIVYNPITFNGNDINQVKKAIDLGNGCVIAVWGDNASWTTSNGVVGLPQTRTWGHWLYAVKYDDSLRQVTVKNSWGTGSGDGGYYYLPYSYFSNGLVMGAYIFSLRPATYYVGLLQTIVNIYKNIISILTPK